MMQIIGYADDFVDILQDRNELLDKILKLEQELKERGLKII